MYNDNKITYDTETGRCDVTNRADDRVCQHEDEHSERVKFEIDQNMGMDIILQTKAKMKLNMTMEGII